jgi:Domain of unknown function (DUF4386)
MTFRWWERWGTALGVLTVAFWVVAFAIGGSNPSTNDSDAQITTYYMSHSHQTRQILGFFVFIAGVLLFLGFLAALRTRLAVAEGEPDRLSALAYGAGIASAVLWIVALALFAAPAFMTNDTKASNLDPNTFRMTSDLGYEIWVAAVLVGAVLVWATSALVLRTGILPRWFGWLGIVVGVLLLFALFFIPAFIYWGWILVAAVLLTWGRRPTPAQLPPPAV